MKKIYAILVISIITLQSRAQWVSVGTLDQVVSCMKVLNTDLFLGGNFTHVNGGTSYWSTKYNSSTGFSNQSTAIGGSGIREFDVFNGVLYAADANQIGFNLGVSSWSGSSWSSAGSFTSSHSGIYADGNDLYVGDDFGEINKKTGSGSFAQFGPTLSGGIGAIIKYNGDIVISGGGLGVAKWDGTAWQTLGTGVSGVYCMAVFNNELYVGGAFTTAGGHPARYIAKWSNSNGWSDVGGSVAPGTFNGIRDMIVHNGFLYVVGDFVTIGGVSANKLAAWNGTSWQSLGFNQGTDFLNAVEAYDNKLYVASFSFTAAVLYSSTTFAGINENNPSSAFSIYPNPAVNNLSVALNGANVNPTEYSFEVYDASGKIMLTSPVESFSDFDISHLPSGIYMALLRKESGEVYSSKFTKQ